MLRNDYILRLADQIAAAFTELLLEGKPGWLAEATQSCHELCRQHVGLELDTVLRLAPEGLRQLLRQAGAAGIAKSAVLAEVLLVHAQLAGQRGDRAVLVASHVHAFHLLREMTPWVDASALGAHERKLETAADQLRELGLESYVGIELARPIGDADSTPRPSA